VSPPRHIGRRTTGVTAPARRKSSSLGLPVPARSSRPPRHRRSRPAACDKCRHRHVTAPDAVRPALNAPVRRTGSSGCGSRAEAGHETRRARLVGEPARDGACTGGSRRAAHRRGGQLRPAWRREGSGRPPQDRRPRTQACTDARRREWRAPMHQPTPRRAQPVFRRQPGTRQIPTSRRSDEDERRAPSRAALADD
jgi:hypothetical protein